MFSFLKRPAASLQADPDALQRLRELSGQTVFVLSLNPSGEFRGDPQNPDAVIAWMDQNARETSAGRPLDIYCYKEGERRLMPFFSSSGNVSAFVQSDPAHKWKAFTNAGLAGAKLFPSLLQAAAQRTQIVLNPRSGSEQLVSSETLQAVIQTMQ